MSTDSKELQKGLIITDNFSKEPILDFDSYSDAIVKMIKNSYPNFTIGIFGEWGTGKTTLMKSIEKKIGKNDQDIITVWFDAWKYENEKEAVNYIVSNESALNKYIKWHVEAFRVVYNILFDEI